MNYMTPKEAAIKWGVSLRRVQFLCNNNRITGAQLVGRRWLIPINSDYPKRIKKSETAHVNFSGKYNFPFFLFSDYYVSNRDLSPEEHQLLNAQNLLIKGKPIEAISICHELEKSTLSESVMFGAYFTIAHASIPLGLYYQVEKYMNLMEKTSQNASKHSSDYQLLIAYTKFQYTYNTHSLKSIAVAELSSDAVTSYMCILLQASILESHDWDNTALKIYEGYARCLEECGNSAPAFIFYSVIGLYYGRIGNKQGQTFNIDKACRIGCNAGIYYLITKYSSLIPEEFQKCLIKYDNNYAKDMDLFRKENQLGWRVVYNAARGHTAFPNCTADEADFLMLLSYGLSNKKIAMIKDISNKELNKRIRCECEKYDLKTKAELVTYAKNIFSSN